VASYRLIPALALLGLVVLCGAPQAHAMLPPFDEGALLAGDDTSPERTQFAQAQPLPTPSPSPTQPAATPAPAPSPAPSASASPVPADEPIGNVATLVGTATVIRNKDSIALKLKDDIFLNDTVQTSAGASLGITFNDDTTFHLSANAKITIDSYVYEEGGSKNTGVFDIGKGTVAFVAASVAKTGNMQINTPAASLGIRGTTGVVEVPEGGAAAAGAHNIKLYPDADGRIGRIEVSDRQGARLGTLTQGASGFAVRPGVAGARAAAVPLTISPQQATRDRGFVSQVHQAQTVGRQIVTEQRAIRRANPPQPGQAPRQPGQQQPQQQPARPGQPQQPGAPKATPQPGAPKDQKGQKQPGTPKGEKQLPGAPKGQKQLPGAPNGQKQAPGTAPTPGAPNRQGQQTPGTPSAPGAPRQPATPNRQGLQQAPGGPQSPAPTAPTGPVRSGQGPQGPATPPQPAAQPRPGGLQQGAPGGLRQQLQRPRLPAPQKGKKKER
jgi:FecR protein